MASIKVKFRISTSNGKEGILYYQIIHQRVSRQVTTNYKIFINEWNEKDEAINIDYSNTCRKDYLDSIQYKIQNDLKRYESIIQKLTIQLGSFTADDVMERFRNRSINSSLFEFMETLIATYKRHGQHRTGETYLSTLNSIKRFRDNQDIQLMDIDTDLIVSYERYLKLKGVQHNTISFYMHRLRAVYNKAVEEELIDQRFPFKHLKIGIEKTVKRAIPIKYIKRLKSLELKEFSTKDLARDLFLFSFYTRGMSFIDIAYLQKKDLKNGTLSYRRKKTGQKLFIHWETCMEHIVNKHKSGESSPYLFSILDPTKSDTRKQYHNTLTLINRHLKKLGEEIGLEIPLTMYVARHSWATTAHSKGIPISIISEGMGHDNEKTTQIYLASLDNKIIDNANRKIIKLI